jgi:HEAT repeat protein
MAGERDAIPIPRIRTVVVTLVLAVVAWNAWSALQEERTRDVLWDPTASSAERLQATEKYVAMGRDAVPELLRGLEGADVRTREFIALAFARIGPEAEAAVPSLRRLLSDPDEEVQLIALRALGRIGASLDGEIKPLIALLSSTEFMLRVEAAAALIAIEPPAIDAVCDAAESREAVVRRHCVGILGQIGEGDRRAAEIVHRAIGDPDGETRLRAVETLITWHELTLDEAAAALRDCDAKVSASVAAHMRRVGRGSERLVPELAALLHHPETRGAALAALTSLGSQARSAIPDLLALLKRTHPRHRPDVIRALGKAARGEQSLAPLILPYLESDRFTAQSAGEALRRISPATARRAAAQRALLLDETDAERRISAAAALEGLGRESAEVIQVLIEALDDENTTVRFHAAGALRQLGDSARTAIPRLAEISRTRSLARDRTAESPIRVRVRAIEALASIGGQDAIARQALLAATHHQDVLVRCAALDALAKVDAGLELSQTALIDALSDADAAVRARAALALARTHVGAGEAVPLLQEMVLVDVPLVQKAAAAALGAYGAEAESAAYVLHTLARQPEHFINDEERAESELSDLGLRYETSEPLYYLARRNMRSTAIRALRKVDPTRRA